MQEVVVEATARPATSVPPKPGGAGELRVECQAFLGLSSCWALWCPEPLWLLGEPLATEAECHEGLQALLGIGRSLQLMTADSDVAGPS